MSNIVFSNSINASTLLTSYVSVLPVEETAAKLAQKCSIKRTLLEHLPSGKQYWKLILTKRNSPLSSYIVHKWQCFEEINCPKHKKGKPEKKEVFENLLSTAQMVANHFHDYDDILSKLNNILNNPDVETYNILGILNLYEQFRDEDYIQSPNDFIGIMEEAFTFLTFLNNNFSDILNLEPQSEEPKTTYNNSLNSLLDYTGQEEFKHFNEMVGDFFNNDIPDIYLDENKYYILDSKLGELFESYPELKEHIYYHIWYVRENSN